MSSFIRGLPPGPSGDTLVQAAQRSFRSAAKDAYDGYAAALADMITERLDPDVPNAIRLETALRDLLGQTEGQGRAASYSQLLAGAGSGTAGEWSRDVFARAYSLAHFSRAIRSMGSKAGFAGPLRGAGQPRLVLEAPLLALLTRSVLEEPLPFSEFVDRLRERVGLIVGWGGGFDLPARARVFPNPRVAETQLRRMERLLRGRMVTAGLARVFSDSHTMVFPHD